MHVLRVPRCVESINARLQEIGRHYDVTRTRDDEDRNGEQQCGGLNASAVFIQLCVTKIYTQ